MRRSTASEHEVRRSGGIVTAATALDGPGIERDPLSPTAQGGRPDRCPSLIQSVFRRAVIALAGGTGDDRIVQLVSELGRPTKAELVAVHVVEIGWSLPLDADIAARSEEAQQILDQAEATAEESKMRLEPVLLQARDVGAALVDEATERVGRPARPRPPLPQAVRRRLRHRADHPLRPEARTVRRLGGARAHRRGSNVKIVIVGCGRVGAVLAEAYDADGHEVVVLDLSTRAFDRLSAEFRGRPSAATGPTRTSSGGPAPATPTSSSP